jgi:hypothetical protein
VGAVGDGTDEAPEHACCDHWRAMSLTTTISAEGSTAASALRTDSVRL